MKKLFYTISVLLILNTTATCQQAILYPALKMQLDSLVKVDQQVQQDYINGDSSNKEKFEATEMETFARHTPLLKSILKQYGFPNYDMVGKEGSNNYWLCVQHCDKDLPFQTAVLKLMKKEVDNKKADPKNYAYLTDRVNINSGKPQIYGTQVTYKNRTAIPKQLEDAANVNQRRAAVGLGPIEEYLKMMTEMHRQMNPVKS